MLPVPNPTFSNQQLNGIFCVIYSNEANDKKILPRVMYVYNGNDRNVS